MLRPRAYSAARFNAVSLISVLLSAVMVFVPPLQSLAFADADPPTRVEETSTQLTMLGSWATLTDSRLSAGSYVALNSYGEANVTFMGTGCDWNTLKGPDCGIARVTVDTATPEYVDLYSAGYQYSTKPWSVSGLAETTHTVRVEWTGSKNASATAAFVGVDAFDITGSVAQAPAPARYEQTDANLDYQGIWSTGSHASYSGGTYTYSSNGGVVTVDFDGTGIGWVATKGNCFGIANVSLDGGTADTVDLYAGGTGFQRRVWAASGLASGHHQLKITMTGSKNASSTAAYLSLDAFDIYGTITTRSVPTRYEQTDSNLRYDGTWNTGTSSSYSGGSYTYAATAGTTTVAFTGTSIGWIAPKGPAYGTASVSLDSGQPAQVGLFASETLHRQRVWSASGLSSGYHMLKIAYTGSKNASATSANIGVDAFGAGVPFPEG